MSISRRSSRLVTAVITAAFILIGGAALAFWSLGGFGTGSAATGSLVPLVLTPGATTSDLRPASTTAVAFTVSNSNATSVAVGSFALDTTRGTNGFAVDAGHSGCTLSTLSFTAPVNAAGWTVPARANGVDGTLAVSLSGALAMSSSAASACQGATFTVYLVVGS